MSETFSQFCHIYIYMYIYGIWLYYYHRKGIALYHVSGISLRNSPQIGNMDALRVRVLAASLFL